MPYAFALFADAVPDLGPANPWIQYGCFGIVCLLVAWALWYGFPKAMEKHESTVKALAADHKEAVREVTQAFKEESQACREERQQVIEILSNLREKQ